MHKESVFFTAYRLIADHPGLVPLGLFLGVWFNIQFLVLGNGQAITQIIFSKHTLPVQGSHWLQWCMVVIGLTCMFFITALAKTVLIHYLHYFLQEQELPDARYANTKHLPMHVLVQAVTRVVYISIFTTIVSGIVVVVLFVPLYMFRLYPLMVRDMTIATIMLFSFFVFCISCVSLFASFFTIFFKQGWRNSINAAIDLLVYKWKDVVAVFVPISIVYVSCFLLSVYLVQGFEQFISRFMPEVALFAGNVVLWLCLSVLNVYIYAVGVSLFNNIVKPKIDIAPAVNPV